MISLLSFIIVLVGAFNWLSIGILQFDFIAGIFGSQANIFSRIVYTIVGFSAFWLIYATIRQKGKIFVNGKKENDEQLLGKLKDKLTKKDKKDKDKNQTEHDDNAHSNDSKEPTQTEAVSTQSTPATPPQKPADKPDLPPPITMEDNVGVTEQDDSQS